MENIKDEMKILVPHDSSEYASRALSEAVDIAKRFSGVVTVLHVYHDPLVEEGAELRGLPAMIFLDDVEESLKEAGVQYEISVPVLKPPKGEVMEAMFTAWVRVRNTGL